MTWGWGTNLLLQSLELTELQMKSPDRAAWARNIYVHRDKNAVKAPGQSSILQDSQKYKIVFQEPK